MRLQGFATIDEASACRRLNIVTALLFAVAVAAFAIGCAQGFAARALLVVSGMGVVLATLFLIRLLRPAWRPRTVRLFGISVVCALLVLLPSALTSVDPARSFVFTALILFFSAGAIAVFEAFSAESTGFLSPDAFITVVSLGAAAAVLIRHLLHVAGYSGTLQPWYSLAPPDLLGSRPFDNLFPFTLAVIFPLPLSTALAAHGRRRIFLLTCATIVAAGIVMSFSRTAWVVLAAELAFLAILSTHRRKPILILALLCTAGLLLLPGGLQRAGTLLQPDRGTGLKRLNQWSAASTLAARSPFLGYGAGTFDQLYEPFQSPGEQAQPCPHNLYLHLAVECGIPALVLFLAIAWHVMTGLVRDKTRTSLCRGFATALAGLFVYGFFDL